MAEDLDIQKHVLRFWESKFAQLRPMKRGGGRRYYRPEDVELLRGIHHLLRAQAYTIKGVQRILREEGAEFVKACWKGGGETPDAGGETRAAPAAGRGRRGARGEMRILPGAPAKARRGPVEGAARGKVRAVDEAAGVSEAVGHLEEAREALTKTRELAGASSGRQAAKGGKSGVAKVAPAKRGVRTAAGKTKRG